MRQLEVSLSLPKRTDVYEAEHLFPFFTNLLPEGANRKVVCREKRIDDKDFFGMLMATVGTVWTEAFHQKLRRAT